MNTWISKTAVIACGLAFLSACDDSLPFLQSGNVAQQMTQTPLAGGDIVVSTPPGYCIDASSVKKSQSAGFAMIARCDTLGGRGFAASRDLVLITVTTAPRDNGQAPTIEGLIASAAPKTVVGQVASDTFPLVRLSTDQIVSTGISREHWRGAFLLNGQLVGLALYTPDQDDMSDEEEARLLQDLANRIQKYSPNSPD